MPKIYSIAKKVALFLFATLLYLSYKHSLEETDARISERLSSELSSYLLSTDFSTSNVSAEIITSYVKAILDPTSNDQPRLACPVLSSSSRRYDALKKGDGAHGTVAYFFALNLRDVQVLLPRLLGSVVEAIRFLGPSRCALSIVESNSWDGTPEVLAALRPVLAALGTKYFLQSSDLDPKAEGHDRIAELAALRNLALQPLVDSSGGIGDKTGGLKVDDSTTVVFLNDVAACTEDVLELVHQRREQGADMVCAMDWTHSESEDIFYDIWVARGITGDLFFHLTPDGSWRDALYLFWNDDTARTRFEQHQSMQVFSCWNGAVVFGAKPLLRPGPGIEPLVRFRSARDGECFQGEPQLFAKDLWFHGYGKIAVVPSVNLAYTDQDTAHIKKAKGYTSQWTSAGNGGNVDDKISWQTSPPAMVKCMPTFDQQSFRPWNEAL